MALSERLAERPGLTALRHLGRLQELLGRPTPCVAPALEIGPNLHWFQAPGGPWVDLRRKSIQRRLLACLVAAREQNMKTILVPLLIATACHDTRPGTFNDARRRSSPRTRTATPPAKTTRWS